MNFVASCGLHGAALRAALVRQGLLDEDQNFLQKPFTPDTLIRRVAELLLRDKSGS